MRIAVCDDDLKDAQRLKHLLVGSGCVESDELSLFTNGTDLLKKQTEGPGFEIIFLDVEMSSINGIELGKRLRDIDYGVVLIFVTAHPKYAVNSFECRPFYYLLKPCSVEKLSEVLNKAKEFVMRDREYQLIKKGKDTRRIPLSSILYVEYARRHVLYHLTDSIIETVDNMDNACRELENRGFFRVHQAFLVNLEKIERFEIYDVFLENGDKVPVSARRKTLLRSAYAEYVMRYK